MIDVMVSETKVLTIAYDLGQCEGVVAIEVNEAGLITLIDEEQGRQSLKTLPPRMFAMALECVDARMIALDGWEVHAVRPCRLILPASLH